MTSVVPLLLGVREWREDRVLTSSSSSSLREDGESREDLELLLRDDRTLTGSSSFLLREDRDLREDLELLLRDDRALSGSCSSSLREDRERREDLELLLRDDRAPSGSRSWESSAGSSRPSNTRVGGATSPAPPVFEARERRKDRLLVSSSLPREDRDNG